MFWKVFIPRKQDLRQHQRSGRSLQKVSLPAVLLQRPPAPSYGGMVPAGHQEITHRQAHIPHAHMAFVPLYANTATSTP